MHKRILVLFYAPQCRFSAMTAVPGGERCAVVDGSWPRAYREAT